MHKKIIVIFVALIFILGVTFWATKESPKESDFLSAYGLDQMNLKEIISTLEQKLDEPSYFSASITGSKLYLGDDKDQIEIDLPNNAFYLSFAPYISKTHPCANHNLVTCRGELTNTSFYVTVTDINSNQIILDDTITSSANGFAGIWLPRNKNYRIEVSYQGFFASNDISTYNTSNTCLTTLKLT